MYEEGARRDSGELTSQYEFDHGGPEHEMEGIHSRVLVISSSELLTPFLAPVRRPFSPAVRHQDGLHVTRPERVIQDIHDATRVRERLAVGARECDGSISRGESE